MDTPSTSSPVSVYERSADSGGPKEKLVDASPPSSTKQGFSRQRSLPPLRKLPRGDDSSLFMTVDVHETARFSSDDEELEGVAEDGLDGEERNSAPAALSWSNLRVESSDQKKQLLDGSSGEACGELVAIMGPSGAGKSTLLNALALRWQGIRVTGHLRIDGKPYSTNLFKKIAAFVSQDDVLFPDLTVLETLTYAAALRLPNFSDFERKTRVETVLKRLGLMKCRNVVVGNDQLRGISGGERKRLAIGIEILTNPKLIFLDEPTSGLDSPTALALMELLKKLVSHTKCTIVCTIHQPQSKIFWLFDSLLVISRSRILIQGSPREILKMYKKAGFPASRFHNPADHILDVITGTSAASKVRAQSNETQIENIFKSELDRMEASKGGKKAKEGKEESPKEESEATEPPSDSASLSYEHQSPSVRRWFQQYSTLLHRAFTQESRQRAKMIILLGQTIVMACLIGFVFFRIGETQTSTVRRLPSLFFCVVNQGIFAALILINSFPFERAITLHERAAGMYHVSAYFCAKITVDLIFGVVPPIFFSVIVYFLIGYQALAAKFFIFLGFMILCNIAASSLALAISAIFRTTSLSVAVLPLGLEIARLFGGFFLSPKNLPMYFAWVDAFSYVKYSYVGIALNELEGLKLHCTPAQLINNSTCPVTTGEQTILLQGFDKFTMGICAGVLVAYIVFLRLVAYGALKWIKF